MVSFSCPYKHAAQQPDRADLGVSARPQGGSTGALCVLTKTCTNRPSSLESGFPAFGTSVPTMGIYTPATQTLFLKPGSLVVWPSVLELKESILSWLVEAAGSASFHFLSILCLVHLNFCRGSTFKFVLTRPILHSTQELRVWGGITRTNRSFTSWLVKTLGTVRLSLKVNEQTHNTSFVPTPGTAHRVSCCVRGGRGTTQRYKAM